MATSSARTARKSGTGRGLVLLALVMGLIMAGLMYVYLSRVNFEMIRVANLNLQSAPATVSVLVAQRDIPPRTLITRSMLTLKSLSKDAAHPDAVAKFEDAQGQVTRVSILAGEQVLATKFESGRDKSGLAFTIPQSKRSVSIAVNEVVGSGGLILPGDRVDVIAVFDAKTVGKDMAMYVLQNAEVLAVGQTYAAEAEGQTVVSRTAASVGAQGTATPAPSKQAAAPTAKSVTLAVTPEEAQRLVLAETRGKLRLVLRPYGEQTYVDIPEAGIDQLRKPILPEVAQITAASISPNRVRVGQVIKIDVTVKNTSDKPLRSQGPVPRFTYKQDETFVSVAQPSVADTYRIGVNLRGDVPVTFPYRWGFGGDIPPGGTITLTGYIQATKVMEPTTMWVGLLREPATVLQDSMATTLVQVDPADVAKVKVGTATARTSPNATAPTVFEARQGDELMVLGQEGTWVRVKQPDGTEGWVMATTVEIMSGEGK